MTVLLPKLNGDDYISRVSLKKKLNLYEKWKKETGKGLLILKNKMPAWNPGK